MGDHSGMHVLIVGAGKSNKCLQIMVAACGMQNCVMSSG